MEEDDFINIEFPLSDEKSEEIAEVLGNKTCKRILEILTENTKGLTVKEIADELNIPINTADYNTKKLLKTGLIENNDHFWSIRGKRMPSYKISNKKITISPKKENSKSKITSLGGLGAFIVTGLIALGIKISNPLSSVSKKANEEAFGAADKAVNAGGNMARETYESSIASASEAGSLISQIPFWGWFLAGSWISIIIFIVVASFIESKSKSKTDKKR